MSAWIVSRAHIDVLVQALTADAGLTPGTPDEIGRELWAENLASVAYRYPRDTDGDRPGPLEFRDSDVETYTYREPAKVIPDAGILMAVDCYTYQSCEHPGWNKSRAVKWMDTLKMRHATAESLDKYPWGFDEDDVHGESGPYCLDCLQPRNSAADRHCRATSTRRDRTYHRWSNEPAQTNADLWR